MVRSADKFLPNKANHELYSALSSEVIQKLYPALEGILKDLVRLTTEKQQ
jgi:hypothetical protein